MTGCGLGGGLEVVSEVIDDVMFEPTVGVYRENNSPSQIRHIFMQREGLLLEEHRFFVCYIEGILMDY